jgi:4-amino-4-deoxy-L-arabinose transferase-like glycosyltransferase
MPALLPSSAPRPFWRDAALPIVLALVVFLAFLGRRDIVTSHEARVVQVARHMAAAGWPWRADRVQVPAVGITYIEGNALRLGPVPDRPPLRVNPWLVPVLNGQVRLQKPPLPYWCLATLFRLFGLDESLARLPSALMGALGTLLVLDLARRLMGRRAGRIAALIWVSSFFMIDEYRRAMADPYLAFFTLVCVWAWIRASALGHRTLHWVLVFYVSLALGALAKAPVNFLHVGIALLAFHCCYRRRVPGAWWQHVIGIAAFVVIALPWAAYVWMRVPHVVDLWRYESLGEMGQNVENAREWWYYLPEIFRISIPWTPAWLVALIIPFAVGRRPLKPPQRRRLFPLLWYAITVIFFSFANLKKATYLLPMMPAQVLLITQGLLAVFAIRRRRPALARDPLIIIQFVIGVGSAIILPVVLWMDQPAVRVVLLLPVLAFIAALRPLGELKTLGPIAWARSQAIAYSLLVLIWIGLYISGTDNDRSPRTVAEAAAARLRDSADVTILTSRVSEEVSVYLPVDVSYDPRAPRVLAFVNDRRNTTAPDAQFFSTWVPDARIVEVRQLQTSPDGRWKLFELHVQRY